MISLITVYNDRDFFKEHLWATLKTQNIQYEVIEVDNSQSKFKSAAAALNYGASKATGKYLLFAHQDMRFINPDTLSKIERHLDNIPNLGIAGVFGLTETGKEIGCIISTFSVLGEYSDTVQEVQTLDECLFIIPKKVFNQTQFDDKILDGWHLYAVDYSLTCLEKNLRVCVLPELVHHFSLAINQKDLFKYQIRVWNKHRKHFKKVYTTCGKLKGTSLMRKWFKGFFHKEQINALINLFNNLTVNNSFNSLTVIICKQEYPATKFHFKNKSVVFSSLNFIHTLTTSDIVIIDVFDEFDYIIKELPKIEAIGKHIYICYRSNKCISEVKTWFKNNDYKILYTTEYSAIFYKE